MKKIVLLLSLTMCFGLVGCSGIDKLAAKILRVEEADLTYHYLKNNEYTEFDIAATDLNGNPVTDHCTIDMKMNDNHIAVTCNDQSATFEISNARYEDLATVVQAFNHQRIRAFYGDEMDDVFKFALYECVRYYLNDNAKQASAVIKDIMPFAIDYNNGYNAWYYMADQEFKKSSNYNPESMAEYMFKLGITNYKDVTDDVMPPDFEKIEP